MKSVKDFYRIYSIDHVIGLLLLTIFITSACTSKEIETEKNSNERINNLDNEIVLELNKLTYTVADQHDHFYSFIGIRTLTMVHLAIHDVLNSIEAYYKTYAYHKQHPEADPVAAVSHAVRRILLNVYPELADTINLICEKWLKTVDDSIARNKGIELGNAVSNTYITLRNGDGHEKQGDYTPMTKPGDYQYTPGWNNWVLKPDFNYARPFAMDTVIQFRSPPPPDLKSDTYTDSFNEVKAYGVKGSTIRSKDQTNYAHWWAEFAEHGWNRIGRITASKNGLSIHETARMFALINMDIYDIYLASLESKYFYDTWRPYTAIRNADTDGNPETDSDPHWEPEMLTPPWPEYPSAHAAVGAGGAEIVSHVYGTSEVSFTMESVTALPNAKTRSYTNLVKAAQDCADSRILNGYHFRFATKAGKKQGRQIAKYIIANYLKPIEKKSKR